MRVTPPADLPPPDPTAETPEASRLSPLFNRLHPSPETLLLVLSLVIGGVTGAGVVTFHYLIHFIHSLMLEDFMGAIASKGPWTLACIPTLGGVIIGLMRWRFRDFGPNMSSLIAATRGLQELSPLKPITKMVAASVSLGTGASLGPEAPSVEIGANFGMLLAQVLQLSPERQRLLLGAGAAAGLSAGFNSPIAGVFFALEVVLGSTFATSSVSVVLLSAVVSALIAQICLGAQPAFALPVYDVRSPLELPLYMGLGLLASCVSLAYTEAIQLTDRCFQGKIRGFGWLGRLPRPFHPILGGAIVGLVALQFPQVLGVGYETVEAMLQDVKFSLPLLLLLLFVKLAVTAISLASGLVGGIFAPAMFLGACLGSAYGIFLEMLPAMSDRVAGPAAYAMVGMAAILAGSAKAPLTAILLMFELTRDYRIVLPLMAAVGLSVWLVEFVNRRSTTHSLNLHQMGVDVAVNSPIAAREQLQDWEDVLGDRIVTELISCQLPIDGEQSSEESELAIVNAHLPENVKSLPETKSAV
ncbi:chloride channel protein [Tychonema sp. LEGE 07203]|uniref:chloride channel protein n=1 Tax=Tychonema sp. LEGE 07203 TaxID=1828671 RepID=UPI0018811E69|nr:chloride channel protein [Tychonema sp. LEGE 07203]MBE9094291.1 chloride channel protein [Tychonema sp. LEGE 07203]